MAALLLWSAAPGDDFDGMDTEEAGGGIDDEARPRSGDGDPPSVAAGCVEGVQRGGGGGTGLSGETAEDRIAEIIGVLGFGAEAEAAALDFHQIVHSEFLQLVPEGAGGIQRDGVVLPAGKRHADAIAAPVRGGNPVAGNNEQLTGDQVNGFEFGEGFRRDRVAVVEFPDDKDGWAEVFAFDFEARTFVGCALGEEELLGGGGMSGRRGKSEGGAGKPGRERG